MHRVCRIYRLGLVWWWVCHSLSTDIDSFVRTDLISNVPSSSFPPCTRSTAIPRLFTFSCDTTDVLIYSSSAFRICILQKRTIHPSRKYRPLEQVDRHELCALPHLFRDARIPVLDLYKFPHSIIVPRIAHVQWPSWIPIRWSRSSSDMSCGELACNFFDQIRQRVVSKMTYESN
jgi:hypothetical protein